MLIDGTTGYPLDYDVQNFFSGSPINRFDPVNQTDMVVEGFRQLMTNVRESAMNQIIRNHTRVKSYMGRNNQTYTKECKPLKKDVYLSDATQIFYPECHTEFGLAGKNRQMNLYDRGSWDFNVRSDNLHTCDVCGSPADKRLLLCNECGNICHEPKMFSKHGMYCKHCNKTICRACANYYNKFLFFKVPVCKECAGQMSAKGVQIKKFPIL